MTIGRNNNRIEYYIVFTVGDQKHIRIFKKYLI